MGMDANDMKLFSAIIVALALVIPVILERRQQRLSYSKGGER
jgi:putative ABC transport system permease protein